MLNKLSIRLRLTILSVLMLTICCAGLTMILNLSANRMADVIEATPITPANSVDDLLPKIKDRAIIMMTPSSPSQAARKAFLNQSIFYMMLVVVIGGVLTYIISGRALKPLNELSKQMKNRTVHNLSESLEIPQSHDEIADLTCAFNEMAHKLDEAFAMQKRFSASAAHELRTPLTVLKTKVDVFKKKRSPTPEDYDKLLNVISKHTNRLSDLVKDLLDFTNMDSVECGDTIEMKSLLTSITDELSLLAKEKYIDLSLTGKEHIIHGNRILIHIAFYNLIENAIKYNKESGSVNIALSSQDDHAIITIADTGIGIPHEFHELIFEPFYRVDKSRSRSIGGAGLGLSTVKVIIDKHQGKISVSETPSGGSCFNIIL